VPGITDMYMRNDSVLDKFYANNTCNPRSKLRYSIENYCRSLLEWYFAALQGNAASQVTTVGSYKNILFVNLHRGPGAGLVCSYDAQAARTLLRLIRDDHRKAPGVRRSGTPEGAEAIVAAFCGENLHRTC
jgi:hypothetical protein